MRYTLAFWAFILAINVYAQTSRIAEGLAGNYSASFNGDELYLSLEKNSGNTYGGIMKDSYQTYTVALTLAGTRVTGTAKESTLGLEFKITGQVQGDQLPLNFTIEVAGESNSMDIVFAREGSAQSPGITYDDHPSAMVLPAGAQHPQEVVGTWAKEELYQSGYGDNYMGSSFTQSMTFLADGHLAEGASSAYMSGSNYNGQSSGQGGGVIPGAAWYTIGNQLYMMYNENGQTQTVHLGKYYVEGNNMLITGTNGEKILLSRK
jgi:hypothetical protein